MALSGPLVTEAQWQKIAPLASPTASAPPERPPVGREPPCSGRNSMDSPQRRSLAGPAGEVSTSFHVLAAAAGLGRAGRVAESATGSGIREAVVLSLSRTPISFRDLPRFRATLA